MWYQCNTVVKISIHALLAESDSAPARKRTGRNHFYPRSPCGERLLPSWELYQMLRISIHALLAESDATNHGQATSAHQISIHALLAESDVLRS